MEIRTTRQIYDAEDIESNRTGNEAIKTYQNFMNKKWVSIDDLKKTRQFACLESWCKSRGKGTEYCNNCKKLEGEKNG